MQSQTVGLKCLLFAKFISNTHEGPSLWCAVSSSLSARAPRAAAEARGHCRQQDKASLPASTSPHSTFLPAELKHTTGPFLNYLASKLGMLLILLLSPCTHPIPFASALSTTASEDWMVVAVQPQLCQCYHCVHSSLLTWRLFLLLPPQLSSTITWLCCSFNHSLTCFCEDQPDWFTLFK